MDKRPDPLFCTAIAKCQLPEARLLAKSLKQFYPKSQLVVLLADRLDGYFDPVKEPFSLVELESLKISNLNRFCFQYSQAELTMVIKPYFFLYLFDALSAQKLIFLDPEFQSYEMLESLKELLEKYHLVLPQEFKTQLHLAIESIKLTCSTQSRGLFGLSASIETAAFLEKWKQIEPNSIHEVHDCIQACKKNLMEEGYEKCKNWPYSFDYFSNHSQIKDAHRKIYKSLGDTVEIFQNPFVVDENNSYFIWFKNIPKGKSFGINLVGHLHSEKGMGTGVRSLAASLQDANIPFLSINKEDVLSSNIDRTITDLNDVNSYLINLIHLNADATSWFAENNGIDFFNGYYNIGFWNWELLTFPEQWRRSAEYLHEIWVPSTYTQTSLLNSINAKVRCIPYAISVPKKIPDGITREFFNLPQNKKIFLFAFDFSSIVERKNPKAVIEAFIQAFGDQDDVLLLLKTIHGERYPADLAALYNSTKGNQNIKILDKVLSRSEMYALTKLSDVFVSLHRCEGFGLHIFEAMALEMPVIVTAFSSNMDFTNEDNSFLVDYKLIKIDKDYGPYQAGELWAEPEVDHAARLMRLVYEKPELAAKKARQAAADMQDKLSHKAIGKLIKKAIFELVQNEPIADFFPPYFFKKNASIKTDPALLLENSLSKTANVSHFPMSTPRRWFGNFVIFVKKAIRRLLRPSLDKQTEFNMLLINQLKEFSKKDATQEHELEELQNKLWDLKNRHAAQNEKDLHARQY